MIMIAMDHIILKLFYFEDQESQLKIKMAIAIFCEQLFDDIKLFIIYLLKQDSSSQMPSTLYESVKQSVVEYTKIKEKNQRAEEKTLFRWKLITIALAIIFIILLGVFSQYLTQLTSLPDVDSDKSYIVSLLNQVNSESVVTLAHASNLIKGITATADNNGLNVEWNSASSLFSGNLLAEDVLTKIKGHNSLLFVLSHQYNATYTARFGFYAHKGYANEQIKEDQTVVKDEGGTYIFMQAPSFRPFLISILENR